MGRTIGNELGATLEKDETIVKRAHVTGTVRRASTGWELTPPPLTNRTAELILTNKRLILIEKGIPDLRLLGSCCPACTVPDEIGTPQDLAERGDHHGEPSPHLRTTLAVRLPTIRDSRTVKPFLRRERLRVTVENGPATYQEFTFDIDDPNSWTQALRRLNTTTR